MILLIGEWWIFLLVLLRFDELNTSTVGGYADMAEPGPGYEDVAEVSFAAGEVIRFKQGGRIWHKTELDYRISFD